MDWNRWLLTLAVKRKNTKKSGHFYYQKCLTIYLTAILHPYHHSLTTVSLTTEFFLAASLNLNFWILFSTTSSTLIYVMPQARYVL